LEASPGIAAAVLRAAAGTAPRRRGTGHPSRAVGLHLPITQQAKKNPPSRRGPPISPLPPAAHAAQTLAAVPGTAATRGCGTRGRRVGSTARTPSLPPQLPLCPAWVCHGGSAAIGTRMGLSPRHSRLPADTQDGYHGLQPAA